MITPAPLELGTLDSNKHMEHCQEIAQSRLPALGSLGGCSGTCHLDNDDARPRALTAFRDGNPVQNGPHIRHLPDPTAPGLYAPYGELGGNGSEGGRAAGADVRDDWGKVADEAIGICRHRRPERRPTLTSPAKTLGTVRVAQLHSTRSGHRQRLLRPP